MIWWDYLQASEINSLPGFAKRWKVVIPTDASYAAYYAQAINKGAPNPAAARLWEEFLYSTPVRTCGSRVRRARSSCPTCREPPGERESAGALPPAPAGVTNFPTQAQLVAAKAVVAQYWPLEMGSDA